MYITWYFQTWIELKARFRYFIIRRFKGFSKFYFLLHRSLIKYSYICENEILRTFLFRKIFDASHKKEIYRKVILIHTYSYYPNIPYIFKLEMSIFFHNNQSLFLCSSPRQNMNFRFFSKSYYKIYIYIIKKILLQKYCNYVYHIFTH